MQMYKDLCIPKIRLMWDGYVETDNRLLYWEFPGKQRAGRKGKWKAVTVKANQPLELYNIDEDMTESHNLAEQYPDILKALDAEMKRQHHPSENWPIAEDNAVSQE